MQRVCVRMDTHDLRFAVHHIHVVTGEGAHRQLPRRAQHLGVLQQLIGDAVGVAHALLGALLGPEERGHLLVLQGFQQSPHCWPPHVAIAVLALRKRQRGECGKEAGGRHEPLTS